jgi:hypothetical protein
MKAVKVMVAIALFITTITLDRQLVTDSNGQLTASWSVGVNVGQSWGFMMEDQQFH